MKTVEENKWSQIAEITISYNNPVKATDRPTVNSPELAYEALKTIWNKDNLNCIEEFYILLLDRRSRILGSFQVAKGGFNGTLVDPCLLFSVALKARANSIILAHNHPSDYASPSESDNHITQKIVQQAKILGIAISDHIIVCESSFYSYAANHRL